MKAMLVVAAWEAARPLLRRGVTLALRSLWAWELRRERRAGALG